MHFTLPLTLAALAPLLALALDIGGPHGDYARHAPGRRAIGEWRTVDRSRALDRRAHASAPNRMHKRCKSRKSAGSNALLTTGSSASSSKHPSADTVPSNPKKSGSSGSSSGSCFPSAGASIPSGKATKASLASHWCDIDDEYAFLGFSYDQTACQSADQLKSDFKLMSGTYNARYVRLYGACDNDGYLDNLVNAAADAKIGVVGIIWFGFDGGDQWKTRMANYVSLMNSNQKAPYVIRSIAVGSEPLFDNVLPADQLASQIDDLRSKLSAYGTKITLSDMPYGFQSHGDAPEIFKAVDVVQANVLPFFDTGATTGGNAWGFVSWVISYFQEHANGKPIQFAQMGWPSNDAIWKANAASAVASVASEQAFYDLIDGHCADFKKNKIGYFVQIFSDAQLSGWGVLDGSNQPKFAFKPKTKC